MLSNLKKWLAQISISRPAPAKPSLILELVAQVKQGVVASGQGRWEEITDEQKDVFLGKEGEMMRKQAERMADTYSFDVVEQLLNKVETSQTTVNDTIHIQGRKLL